MIEGADTKRLPRLHLDVTSTWCVAGAPRGAASGSRAEVPVFEHRVQASGVCHPI